MKEIAWVALVAIAAIAIASIDHAVMLIESASWRAHQQQSQAEIEEAFSGHSYGRGPQ